ncbi:PD-(D/E)XK nuclease family protein [Brachybacterium sp. FME24]|uniref:PD-(D/E)XK nuclease family protein n=1 Tax=Brachybacterium sp. FME24 TaxID=2742605 RepID=UPI00186823D7|nr:PD-(D/E)XK nuclease family protein [Brachybacterium sp. FME24]
MTTPKLSADTPRGRMYRLEPDGPLLYPSITTVAGMRAKDHLQGWYATMASKRALEMYAWLNRNPDRAAAEISRVSRDTWGTQKRIAAAAPEYTRSAADFGTLVHAACELWGTSGARPSGAEIVEIAESMRAAQGAFATQKDQNDPQALIARADVRLDGYGRFLEDYQPEFVEIEQTVVNHTVGYAGTTDAIVRIGNTMLSADIKTSKKVRGDYALQGVAVCRAEQLLDDDGTEREMPELTGAFIIHLPEAGGYQAVPLRTGDAEFEVFRSLRSSWSFEPDECALGAASGPKDLLLSLLRVKSGMDALD